jgi:hypothetical protein
MRACDRSGNGLLDFVRERGSQFSHHVNPVDVRQISLELPQPFAFLLGMLLFRNIHLKLIAEEGRRRGEVSSTVDSLKLATLIASTLEGSFMVSRLQRNEEPLNLACRHLEEYLDTKVRARQSKTIMKKS